MNDREKAKTLYQELTNSDATLIDFLFWYVLGVLSCAGVVWMVP